MFLSFPGFSAGELSISLEGRSDLDALRQGARRFRNMIPTRLGAALQRPGFMFRGLAFDQGDGIRVAQIPFVASAEFAYMIEAGPNYFRFWRNNSLLLTTLANSTKPGVVSAVGDPLVIATPYAADALFELQYCHANDAMWLAHGDYPVQKLERYAVDEFQFAPMTFLWPPLRDQNVDEITLAAAGTLAAGGTVTLTAVGGDVFEAGDVGGYYGIDHRREKPFAEISLSQGSGTATALLIFSGNAAAAETVSIGTPPVTYTWGAEGAYGVPVGGTQAISLTSLVTAINGSAGAQPGTLAHPQVTADDLGAFTAGIKAAGVLSFTDNNLTAGGSPDEFIIGAQHYVWSNDVTTGSAYHVKVGATLADSIANAILAINATGVAGVNYTTGTAANLDVAADPAAIGNSLRVQALAAGIAGNSVNTTVDHTSRMSWGSSTLTGGADGSTNQLQITSRIEGSIGNTYATAETMTNAAWQPATGMMAGGADTTDFDPSNPAAVIPTVRVNGTWEVYTLGRWYGTLTLQQQRATGEWEVVRTWDSQNDRNVEATGTVNGEKTMRLIFVGSGIQDDDAPARAVLTAIDAIVHGLVLITNVIDSTHAEGTVIKDIWSTDPTYLWSGGSWSERRGYPSAVVLHQQRLVFGQGSRLIGSQTGGFDNFLIGELADDAYQFELAAVVAQNIVTMQSQEGLMILTQTNEWLADGGQDGAVITPSNFRSRQLTEYGSAPGNSLVIHSNVLFIQQGSVVLNEYLFQFARANYEAVNLTELVDTLADEIITGITWAPVPHSLVMATTLKGSLLIMGYRRTSGAAGEGGQLAWTKHVTPDGSLGLSDGTLNGIGDGNGKFESVCAIPGSNGNSDIWAVVRRQLPDGTFVRTVENWDLNYFPLLKEGSAASAPSLVLLDGSLTSSVLPITPVVTGLGHLEGLTVGILLNGTVYPPRTVEGGQITLNPDDLPPDDVSAVVVGLIPVAELQPFLTVIQMKDGPSEGRTKRIAKLNIRFYQAGACQYADSPDSQFYDVDFRTGGDPIGEPVALLTGLRKNDLAGGWLLDTEFCFRNASPLPMNILSVTPEMTVVG